MHLYILEIQDSKWNDYDEYFLQFISCERKDKIKRYKFDIDKKLSLYGALLVRMGIMKKLNCKNHCLRFVLNEYGKPCLVNNKNSFFNLSHTRNAMVCGVADVEIGVDIERIIEPCSGIVESCFHHEEKILLKAHEDDFKKLFFKFWTQKEAYTKCSGVGIVQDLSKINVLNNEIQGQFITEFYGDYVYSVFSEKCMEEVKLEIMNVKAIDKFFGSNS